MAVEEKDEGQEQSATKPSGKKGLIIIISVALLAVALSVGATIFFLLGDDTSGDAPVAEAHDDDVTAAPATGPAVYLELNPAFQVGFDVNGRQRFMQVFISAQARSQDAINAMEFHMPTIRSRLLSAYSSEAFGSLQTEEGKLALRDRTLSIINEVLEQEKAPKIENVFFTNFVLQ